MLAQLQSGNPEDRVCGCHALARHSSTTTFARQALTFQAPRVAGPLMSDNDPMVRLAAVGALKNLSALHPDVAEALVEQDILTPLSSLLASYPSTWTPPLDTKTRSDHSLEILVQALDLLWNLVEASSTALKLFNSQGMLEFVLRFSSPSAPPDLLQACLCTLAAVSDSNPQVNQVLLGKQEELLNLMSPSLPLLSRITTAITLLHINGASFYSSPSLVPVMDIVAQCFEEDLRTMVTVLVGGVAGEDMEVGEIADESPDEIKFREVKDLIKAQHTALEVLMNLGCLEEDGEWQDESEEEESFGSDDEEDVEIEKRGEVNPVFVEAVVGRTLLLKV